jgi:hypothetical protein
MDYSWYVPKLTYVIRASYDRRPASRSNASPGICACCGVLGSLQSDGNYTIAHYAVDLAPGFWVPQWIVRAALRRDLPKMLRALRTRAEFVQMQSPSCRERAGIVVESGRRNSSAGSPVSSIPASAACCAAAARASRRSRCA